MVAAPEHELGPTAPMRIVGPRPPAAVRRIAIDVVLVGVLLVAALPYRLANIDVAAPKSDEGIRLLQLFLMSEGFRPVRDIFASQGPLSLDVSYPLFALFGGTLAAARLAVVVYSLVEIAACYLVARQLGGRIAGLVAGLLLVLSPVFLKTSRTAYVEVPALVPATLAILFALWYADRGGRASLIASAVLLALALLTKPLVLAAGAPVLVALLMRGTDRWRGLAAYAGVSAALIVLVVLLVGPAQLYDQVIRYRVGSAQAEGWSLAGNLDTLADELRAESYAWWALAMIAVPLCLVAGGVQSLPAVAWAAGTFLLLLVYSPLMPKHPVVLVPSVAVLVGSAIGCGWRRMRSGGPGHRPDRRRAHPARLVCRERPRSAGARSTGRDRGDGRGCAGRRARR